MRPKHSTALLRLLLATALSVSMVPATAYAEVSRQENQNIVVQDEETDLSKDDVQIDSSDTSGADSSEDVSQGEMESDVEEDKPVATMGSSLDDSESEADDVADGGQTDGLGPQDDIADSFRFEDGNLISSQEGADPSSLSKSAGISTYALEYNPDKGINMFNWFDPFGSGYCTGSEYLKGIDVSVHNGYINWSQVKASGVDYAIIRCGYGNDERGQDDGRWLENVRGCLSVGMPFGVYIYSYATNTSMAASEARHVLRCLSEAGLSSGSLAYPVYYDMEDKSTLGAPLGDIAQTFCSTIKSRGYEVGVYSGASWWNNYLTDSRFNNWYKWVAQWNASSGLTYSGASDFANKQMMWQFSDFGLVPGINHRTDLNYTSYGAIDASFSSMEANVNKDTGEIVVTVKGLRCTYKGSSKSAPITSVAIPTWSPTNGSNDLVWHSAANQGNGTYVMRTGVWEHKGYTGVYESHLYAYSNQAKCNPHGIKYTVELSPGSVTVALSADERSATVTGRGGHFALASSVSFPTWSVAGGQDDMVWYAASRTGSGWQATVPISRHATAGEYKVHAYAVVGGVNRCVGGTGFTVSSPTYMKAETIVSDNTNGLFTEKISGVISPSGVEKVEFGVWTMSDRSDLLWYKGYLQEDGSYITTVNARNHMCNESYNIHIYVTAGNGIRVCPGGDSGDKLDLKDFITIAGAVGSGSRTVMVKNPTTDIRQMSVAAWSVAGNGSDLCWYEGVNHGGNFWTARINAGNFQHAGQCLSDIYINNKAFFLATLRFDVDANEVWRVSGDSTLDSYLRSVISAHGTDLYTLYNYVASYRYIEGSTWPTGNWSIPFAKEMYQNGGGNCYRYAALFCWLAKAAGYDAGVVAGSCPRRGGGTTAHGWTEIYMNGQTYICDPDMQHEMPSRNWYMRTYSSAPMNYYK